MVRLRFIMFQSRNRGSYGFKSKILGIMLGSGALFQSRNRGSYGFKPKRSWLKSLSIPLFQSRNRGSYGFKCNLGDGLMLS